MWSREEMHITVTCSQSVQEPANQNTAETVVGKRRKLLSQGKRSHSPTSEEQRQLRQITRSGDFSHHTESHKDQILVRVRNAFTAASLESASVRASGEGQQKSPTKRQKATLGPRQEQLSVISSAGWDYLRLLTE